MINKKLLNNKILKGKSATNEIVYGTTKVLNNKITDLYVECLKNKNLSLKDFERSIISTKNQLKKFKRIIKTKLNEGYSIIFLAHLLMLEDKNFSEAIKDLIIEGNHPAKAIKIISNKYIKLLSNSSNDYIKEKIYDVQDLVLRLLNNLKHAKKTNGIFKNQIIIKKKLYPSDLINFLLEEVKGIILIGNGITSHVSILARALKIPLIIVENDELLLIPDNSKILINCQEDNIFINPNKNVLNKLTNKNDTSIKKKTYCSAKNIKTLDNKKIFLKANINLLSEVKEAVKFKFNEIGLYRTEFPFMIRNNFPTEMEQLNIYKNLITMFNNNKVTFRTLDIGGDKYLKYHTDYSEPNPVLGLKSIRFSINNKEIFEKQISAILKAGYNSEISIMFPMIYSLDQFIYAKKFVHKIIKKLKNKNIKINSNPKIGTMVEVPSLIEIIDDLAVESDFFSIGTNDLIQYTLATDRTNSQVSNFYIPHHPAILRSLKKIADAGKKHNIEVAICGEMAHNPNYIPFLIGIGINCFSIDTIYLPKVKNTIKKINYEEAVIKANQLLKLSSINKIEKLLFKK